MSNIEQTIFCDGCGVEITWAPLRHGNHRYCCQDCLQGRGCNCAIRQDLDDERRNNAHESQSLSLPNTL